MTHPQPYPQAWAPPPFMQQYWPAPLTPMPTGDLPTSIDGLVAEYAQLKPSVERLGAQLDDARHLIVEVEPRHRECVERLALVTDALAKAVGDDTEKRRNDLRNQLISNANPEQEAGSR